MSIKYDTVDEVLRAAYIKWAEKHCDDPFHDATLFVVGFNAARMELEKLYELANPSINLE